MKNNWRWKEKRLRKAFLALADGTVFKGYSYGAAKDVLGEVVFNTGMTGYQEILSDPSYAGQLVAMTYPEIGNTGINPEDMESGRFYANGFIVHQMHEPSNWRSTETLNDALVRMGIPVLAGLDTRALTSLLREHGTMKGFLCTTGSVSAEEAVRRAADWEGLDGQDYASRVTCPEPYVWDKDGFISRSWGMAGVPDSDLKIVAYDYGIKWNILRRMRQCGMDVTVLPAKTPAEEALSLKPDGVFLSNGPADPAGVVYAVRTIRRLIGKVPIMGICLGHQLLGLALGARTYRLKFGHHGCNHPVQEVSSGRVEITSQNHNFAIDKDSLDTSSVEITHINLNDRTIEGIRHRTEPAFSVQYHPEAGPGPHDPSYLFPRFREMILGA